MSDISSCHCCWKNMGNTTVKECINDCSTTLCFRCNKCSTHCGCEDGLLKYEFRSIPEANKRIKELTAENYQLKATLKWLSYRFKAYTIFYDGLPEQRGIVSGGLSPAAVKYSAVSTLRELGYTRNLEFGSVKIKRVRKYDKVISDLAYAKFLKSRPSDVVDMHNDEDEDLWT